MRILLPLLVLALAACGQTSVPEAPAAAPETETSVPVAPGPQPLSTGDMGAMSNTGGCGTEMTSTSSGA